MAIDHSQGWDNVAGQFIAARSNIGAETVLAWARETISPGASIIDVGCGSGVPISQALIDGGFEVLGIDASLNLVAAFADRFPSAQVACEAAQESDFFNRKFEACVSIGLIFLLDEADQREVIRRIGAALKQGGRFLFTAPREQCEWRDVLTGRGSKSLGFDTYERLLVEAGLRLIGCRVDEGQNNYYDAIKPPSVRDRREC